MKIRIDWRLTLAVTCGLMFITTLLNLLFAALSFHLLVLPLALIAGGGAIVSLSRSPRRRVTLRQLLHEQKKLAKSFVRCFIERQ